MSNNLSSKTVNTYKNKKTSKDKELPINDNSDKEISAKEADKEKKKMLMGDVIINENLKHEMQKNQA